MARQPRDLTRSEWYHVVHRGADRQDIFTNDRDRILFEERLAEAFERFSIDVHAYAWMSNHVHAMVHAPDGGLSEAMHRVGSSYALTFNRLTGRDGPLFTSRFFSKPITSDAQLIQTARYIHRNPLAFVPARALAAYRWSSLAAVIGRRDAPAWLSTGTVVSPGRRDSYLEYVLAPQPADRFAFGDLPPSTPTTCDEIIQAIAAVASIPASSVVEPNRSLEDLRTLAITVAIETRAADAGELATRFGFSDRRSVRRVARRGRVQLLESVDFAARRARVLAHLDGRGGAVDQAA